MNTMKVTHGSDHPDTLTVMACLALLYRKQGRLDEAENMYMDVMNARKERIGLDHPDTLGTMANLASTFASQGKWDEAQSLLSPTVQTMQQVLGSQHPDTLSAMENLSNIYKRGQQNEGQLGKMVKHASQFQFLANLFLLHTSQSQIKEL